MPFMLVTHKVADFDTWKSEFDTHVRARRTSGLIDLHVMRDDSDPNTVVLLFGTTDLDKAREGLTKMTVAGSAGGGAVRALVAGDGQLTKIEISAQALAQADKEKIEELVLAAVQEGIEKAAKLSEETLGKITGGLNLPGLS